MKNTSAIRNALARHALRLSALAGLVACAGCGGKGPAAVEREEPSAEASISPERSAVLLGGLLGDCEILLPAGAGAAGGLRNNKLRFLHALRGAGVADADFNGLAKAWDRMVDASASSAAEAVCAERLGEVRSALDAALAKIQPPAAARLAGLGAAVMAAAEQAQITTITYTPETLRAFRARLVGLEGWAGDEAVPETVRQGLRAAMAAYPDMVQTIAREDVEKARLELLAVLAHYDVEPVRNMTGR